MIHFSKPGPRAIRAAIIAIGLFAQAIMSAPFAHATGETATRPWSAPVGHRQPRAIDIPGAFSVAPPAIDRENANVDRKINGICRGC